MESFSIIAIGNPGAGKSTTLNYLAQEVVFKSGVAIGSGLTFEFDKRTVNNITYCDTPGLNDAGKREAAGKAITEALKEGGKTKILFFIGQESGRPKQDDVTTMNLVLKSAPEIGNNYGVILPKIKKKMTKTFEKLDAWTTFLAGLFAGLEEKHRECPVGNVQGVQLIESLDDEDNVLAAKGELKTLENHPLENFVFNVLPFIDLTPDQAEDIDTTTFEQKQSEIVELIEKSKSDDAKMKSLQEQVEKSRDGSGTLQKALSVAAPIFGCLAKIAAPKLGGRTGEIADVLADSLKLLPSIILPSDAAAKDIDTLTKAKSDETKMKDLQEQVAKTRVQ